MSPYGSSRNRHSSDNYGHTSGCTPYRIGVSFRHIASTFGLIMALYQAQGHLAQAGTVEEASGITRLGTELLIVGDKSPGAYYSHPVPQRHEGSIFVDPHQVTRIQLPAGKLALDLEGIDVLADGRVVVLSERLRALIGNEGVVAEYGPPLTEFGNRGLEGVAVLPLKDGRSRVGVLWEGGYPEYDHMPEQLRDLVVRCPLRPVIWVHHVERGQAGILVKDGQKDPPAVQKIELDVPKPDDDVVPDAQRFRASDLVWHRWIANDHEELGFIVMMGSENSPVNHKREFRYQWLHRFTIDGQPYGEPLDLNVVLPKELRDRNWEGLGWFEPGHKLVIIHDAPPHGIPTAYILNVPDNWH